MADFNQAFKIILAHEGGEVNNPADRGGLTKFGITQTTLNEYCALIKVPTYSVDQVTEADAQMIYKKLFWDRLQLDTCPSQFVANAVVDMAVLRGLPSIIHHIQALCAVTSDGVMGVETKLAFDAHVAGMPTTFRHNFIFACQDKLVEFAVNHPEQLQFLSGWIKRTQDFLV